MRQQFCHKRPKIIGDNVVGTNSEIQPQRRAFRRNRNGRNNRQPVTAAPAVMDGGLSLPGPGSPNNRDRHKAAFIQQNSGFTATFSKVNKIEWLPAYAPQLNPADQVWNRSKYTDLANYVPEDVYELEKAVCSCINHMRSRKPLLRSFFEKAELKI